MTSFSDWHLTRPCHWGLVDKVLLVWNPRVLSFSFFLAFLWDLIDYSGFQVTPTYCRFSYFVDLPSTFPYFFLKILSLASFFESREIHKMAYWNYWKNICRSHILLLNLMSMNEWKLTIVLVLSYFWSTISFSFPILWRNFIQYLSYFFTWVRLKACAIAFSALLAFKSTVWNSCQVW